MTSGVRGKAVRRTATVLADGRELTYFDDVGAGTRRLDDPRDLPETSTLSQLRYDAPLDEWVTIASHRQGRTYLPPDDECPLCPSRGGRQTEIPSDDYDVVVFANRFPSLAGTGPSAPFQPGDLFAAHPGHGRCEVVCFTSDHDSSFAALTYDRVRTVVEAWVDRTTALSARQGVEQVFCFENRGEEIGVTLRHPHGQIYAYPYVTPRTRRTLDSARAHLGHTGRNLFADLLERERADGDRVVVAGEHWTAFVPFAARWPVEVHLYPHRQVPDLAALTDAERDEFGAVYLNLLARLDALYDKPLPYIAAWHQAPVRVDRDLAYLHLEVFSIQRAPMKLKFLAGSESAMGAFVNDVNPEQIAQNLRSAGPRVSEQVEGSEAHDALRGAFREQLGGEAEGVWAAPGRVNLIGEHVDYNDGLVLPFALAQRTYAAVARRDDGVLRVRSLQLAGGLDAGVAGLRPVPKVGSGGSGVARIGGDGDWAAYAAGVLWVLREQGHVVGGLDVLLDGRVPVGAGLSSSAALECSVAVAAAELFGLLLSNDDLARVAQRAENDFVGVPCGLMDQMASIASTAGHALLFDARSGLVEQVPFAPQDAGLTVAVIDTHVKHSVGEGAYADRRSTCEQAAQALGLSSLRDVDPGDLDAVLARVSPEAAPRVRHVVTEIERVGDAVAALRRGDWAGLGRAMTASHESLREDYEVSCDELDVAVAASLAAGALGARMTGAGFGGSAIALVARARLGRLTADVTRAFADKGFPEPSVIEAVAREGARRVW